MLLNCGAGEDSWESFGQQGVKHVNPKGNQPWIFIERIDIEAEAPLLWPPDVKNWLLQKTLILEKIKGRRRRGQQRMRKLDRITDLISLLSEGLSRVFSSTSLKASILRCSAFFMVQLSHQYMTTEKIIALNICTLVGKMMSLLFNMPSRFVIAFLPRSKHLLISWPQSSFLSNLGAQENKICHCFHFFPFYLP